MSPYSSNSQKQTSHHQQQHSNVEPIPQHHQQALMPQPPQIPILPTRNYAAAYVAPAGAHRNPMYHMQVIPNNLYMGNQLAPPNFQYMTHGIPLHMTSQPTSGNYITSSEIPQSNTSISSTSSGGGSQDIPQNSTPLAIQYQPAIIGRGSGRGRGRGGRMSNNINRREYVPRPQHQSYHQQQSQQQQTQPQPQTQQQQTQQQTQHHHHQQQQQQQQSQPQQNQDLVPQTMINSQQIPMSAAAGYAPFFATNPYQPVYFAPSGHMPHQTAAQHAQGAPLLVSMYQPQMYYPNMMYPTMLPPEYMVDEKGEEIPVATNAAGPPTAMWPQMVEMEYPDARSMGDGAIMLDEYQNSVHDQQQQEILLDSNPSSVHHMPQQSQTNQHVSHHQQLQPHPHHHHHHHHFHQQQHQNMHHQQQQAIQNQLENQQQPQASPQQHRHHHVLNPNVPNFVNHTTNVTEIQQLEQIQFMNDDEQLNNQQMEYYNDEDESDQYVLDDYQQEQIVDDETISNVEYDENCMQQQEQQQQQFNSMENITEQVNSPAQILNSAHGVSFHNLI